MALGLPEQKKPNEDHSSQGIVGKVNQTASALKGEIKIPGLPGLPKFSKRGLAKSLVKKGFKKVAVSFFLSPPGLAVIIVVVLLFLTFVTVMAAGCTIVNNPAGDIFGVNYCKSEGPAPTPTPTPQPPGPDEPKIINFTGGYAYLSCSETEPVNCPNLSKGDKVKIYAIIHIDSSFPESIDKKKAILNIGTLLSVLFDIDDANVNPAPSDKGFLNLGWSYAWSLENITRNANTVGVSTYEIVIPLTALSDNGETLVTLSLEGFNNVGGN